MKIFLKWQVCLAFFLLMISIRSYASADTLIYRVHQVFNVNNNEVIAEDSELLVSEDDGLITWRNSSRQFTFSIVGTSATEESAGRVITYFVKRKSYSGRIVTAERHGEMEVSMEFIHDGVNTMPFVFKVYQLQNR